MTQGEAKVGNWCRLWLECVVALMCGGGICCRAPSIWAEGSDGWSILRQNLGGGGILLGQLLPREAELIQCDINAYTRDVNKRSNNINSEVTIWWISSGFNSIVSSAIPQ